MGQPVLLSDSGDAQVVDAVRQLESWRLEVRGERELAAAIDAVDDVRAVLVTTTNPGALRDVFEHARTRGLPVIVGVADDAVRRRAVELRADEWFR